MIYLVFIKIYKTLSPTIKKILNPDHAFTQKPSLYHTRLSGNYKRLIMRKFDIKTPKAE